MKEDSRGWGALEFHSSSDTPGAHLYSWVRQRCIWKGHIPVMFVSDVLATFSAAFIVRCCTRTFLGCEEHEGTLPLKQAGGGEDMRPSSEPGVGYLVCEGNECLLERSSEKHWYSGWKAGRGALSSLLMGVCVWTGRACLGWEGGRGVMSSSSTRARVWTGHACLGWEGGGGVMSSLSTGARVWTGHAHLGWEGGGGVMSSLSTEACIWMGRARLGWEGGGGAMSSSLVGACIWTGRRCLGWEGGGRAVSVTLRPDS